MKEKILRALQDFKGYLLSSDKWLHLAAGFIIAYFFGLVGLLWGLLAGIAAGAAKEIYDYTSKRGQVEWWDFIFTVVGVLSAVVLLGIARLAFHFIG